MKAEFLDFLSGRLAEGGLPSVCDEGKLVGGLVFVTGGNAAQGVIPVLFQ